MYKTSRKILQIYLDKMFVGLTNIAIDTPCHTRPADDLPPLHEIQGFLISSPILPELSCAEMVRLFSPARVLGILLPVQQPVSIPQLAKHSTTIKLQLHKPPLPPHKHPLPLDKAITNSGPREHHPLPLTNGLTNLKTHHQARSCQ